MNGVVNTWNVGEYAPKGQVPEFLYERNDSREKNDYVGRSMWKWNSVGTVHF